MTRWPTCASDGLTAVPTAATMPHGSCPAIVGTLGAASPPVSPPAFGRRYWCRSLLRTQARPEAKGAADILRYFGGLASELKGETIPLGEHVLSYTRREPIGVVGAIIPWNAPVLLAALKIAPALCAGNTLVLKAAEHAPLGVLWLAAICQDHLPKGVLNVVTGYCEEAGAALSAHQGVRKLSFTGSTEGGQVLSRAASRSNVPGCLRPVWQS